MPNRTRITAGMAAGLLFITISLWSLRAYGLQSIMPRGVSFGGIPVGGMAYEAAAALLQERLHLSREWAVQFNSEKPHGSAAGTLQETGLRWDASAPLHAMARLREGNSLERAWHRLRMRGEELPMALIYDESVYQGFVAQRWSEMHSQQPVAAKRTISGQDQVEIIPDIPVYRVDGKELLRKLLAVDWQARWRQPVPAAGQPILAAAIDLSLTEIRSQTTYESLTAQGVERKISEFSTPILPGGEGRFHNISSAARIVQDRLLAPGEIFDYAPVIQETQARFGFQEAPVIYNGKLVPGIGGGICQVSSTLYNAVIRAGLEIVERRNHSLPVSYVPLGQDATFSEGYINFRFRNSTDSHMLIRTETQKDTLTVKLFGKLEQDVAFEIESLTVEELAAPVKTVVNPSLRIGQKETLQKGKPGYVVETYRIKKQNGTILSKELLSKDRYQPQPYLIAVGGSADPKTPGPNKGDDVLEDGIEGPRFR